MKLKYGMLKMDYNLQMKVLQVFKKKYKKNIHEFGNFYLKKLIRFFYMIDLLKLKKTGNKSFKMK